MNVKNLAGSLLVSAAILVVGVALYQQNERHFDESQRWLNVCIEEWKAELKRIEEQVANDETLPENALESLRLGIDAYDEDYVYSRCYKDWHAGE